VCCPPTSAQDSVSGQPGSSDDAGWEGRLIPWEYLLSVTTRTYRVSPLAIVRQLQVIAPPPTVLHPPEGSAGLFVQSAPGRLRGKYTFDIEKRVLESHLQDGANAIRLGTVVNPSCQELQQKCGKSSPYIIHVTGFDTFQGHQLLEPGQKTSQIGKIDDGLYLRNQEYKEEAVGSLPLAQALTSSAQKPAVVTFNFYNSSARTAAFTVAQGAQAAIGFQDYIDDRLAEIFFANFYSNLRKKQWNILAAFNRTLCDLEDYEDRLRETGIVLWSGLDLVNQYPLDAPDNSVTTQKQDGRAADWIEPEIVHHPKLNYSVLHNSKKPLFSRFSVYKFKPATVSDLQVEVELQVGSERFPYRQTCVMKHHVLDLSEIIGVGLTSQLARSISESVQTTLFVQIAYRSEIIHSRTYSVRLLPIDEWKDDEANRLWLPSFVLPRDPAILEVLTRAQHYLVALRDDASAGFDGYQSQQDSSSDIKGLDSQVQAIWYALLHDYQLKYSNPPPTFTMSSQRLRKPSDVLRGQRGTCIDLTLLMAACLEFVEIKPVIFTLDDHAFLGYWTSETSHDEFVAPEAPIMLPGEDYETPLPDEDLAKEDTIFA
jgi:hypothetical protein